MDGTAWTFAANDLSAASHSFTARVENPATGTNGSASSAWTVVTQSVEVTGVDANDSNLLSSTNNQEAAQFVRISNARVDEVEVWAWVGGTLTNVAQGKTLSTEMNATSTSGNAVDGNAGTNSDERGWLQIDLGQQYVIDSIVVKPRTTDGSFAAERINNLTVATSHADMSPFSNADLSTHSNIKTATLSGDTAGEAASLVWTRSYQSSDATPTLSGTLGAALGSNEVLGVYNGDVRIGQATVSGDTNWSFTESTLAAGEYQLRVQVEDATSGTASTGRASSGVYTVFVGTAADPTAQLFSIQLEDDYGRETGVIAPGAYTDDTNILLAGVLGSTLSVNQRVVLYDGDNFLGYADVSGVDWSFALLAELSVGNHSITAVVENVATGGKGTASNALDFVVQGLHLTSITDDSGFIQGNLLNQDYNAGKLSVAGISLIDDAEVTFGGTLGQDLATGQVLKVYNSGALLGTANVTGTDWSFDVSNLAYADHNFVFQIEAANNPGVSLISVAADVSVVVDDALANLMSGSTVNLGGLDRDLDLTKIDDSSQLRIDAINLSDLLDGGSNSVTLNVGDVLNAGTDLYNSSNGWDGLLSNGRNQVKISGDSGDEVTLTDKADWTKSTEATTFNDVTYDIYTNGTAQLLIEQDLTVL